MKIRVGVSIYFCVRNGKSGCRIFYRAVPDYRPAEIKVAFLHQRIYESDDFVEIRPSARHDWIGEDDADFATFLPIAGKATKATRVAGQERAVFRLYSLGISTNRDEWLYASSRGILRRKIAFLLDRYNKVKSSLKPKQNPVEIDNSIKWSRNLIRRIHARRIEAFSTERIVRAAYRPFNRRWLYQSSLYIDEEGDSRELFPPGSENIAIAFSDKGSRTHYCVLATDGLADMHFGAAVDAYQQVTRYSFVDEQRIDNITDWASAEFADRYDDPITKDDIFHYVYGVLHDPVYREKYALDLKREFPRIPFYPEFRQWVAWGERLMALHLGYETVEPWPLERLDTPDERSKRAGLSPKAMLKADKDAGIIRLDGETQLSGVPKEAWAYRLGNRSAVEWVLDQHKERTPKDPTIRERFNTYRFADHKEKVVDLLMRVTRVSVETVAITEAMRGLDRAGW